MDIESDLTEEESEKDGSAIKGKISTVWGHFTISDGTEKVICKYCKNKFCVSYPTTIQKWREENLRTNY